MLAERWWLREVDADYRQKWYSHQIFFKFAPHHFQPWFVKYKLNVGGFVGGCFQHNTVVQPPDLLQLYPSFPGLVCEMLDERWWLSEEGADYTRQWSSQNSFSNFVLIKFVRVAVNKT